ncbi:hypothetical protein O3G_MSEX011847 [Manduca sexta]|uniref:PHD and RING finger domain-containing protein 1 n=1 Tax=Manduca sexta TaxID=7130 RepID=A0A922CVV7_MANSE|nr:hypothetical protein O3G_MSEX011847 [Manduca sexta]
MSDEGDDSPPRPKRRIRAVTVLSSASDSDTDDGVVAATRRKRLRVVSDEETDSSGSLVVRTSTRSRRALPHLRDSDGASDAVASAASSRTGNARGSDTRASTAICLPSAENEPGASSLATQRSSCGFTSDGSEGNSEKCSICLLRFTDQEVGTPETCEHIFCLDCITEWSKNVNTCPVDRITFNSIVVRAFAGGRVLRSERVTVMERRPSVDVLVVEDTTVCEICGRSDNEETMLLCDGCDLGYHMQCLTPPLGQVPENQWLCPNCDANLPDDLIPDIDDIDEYIQMAQLLMQRSRPRLDEPSTVKRRVKKRKPRKRPTRTAARRSHVRQSVRAKLSSLRAEQRLEAAQVAGASGGGSGSVLQDLCARRHRAGIPPLSILGNPNQLDYFSEEEEHGISQGSGVAVAVRPTSHILNSYRQARRKMVTVSSPQHATSAPDILSSILESQTLLHSKNSILSVSVDGNVNIKLETREQRVGKKPSESTKHDSKVDVLKAEDATRKVPSYPGQSRGGGWGGGYRGNYHREQGTTGFGRGSYNEGNYGGGYQNRQGNSYQNNNARPEESDTYNNYARRPHQYSQNDDSAFDRNRRHSDMGRGPSHSQQGPQNQRQHDPGRYRTASSPWYQFGAAPAPGPGPAPAAHHRHSFGGFEDPLDMRTGHIPHHASGAKAGDGFADDAQRRERMQSYRPLPEPPVFNFDKTREIDKSEDERSDSSLVIDTDKYDPTEPTRDDDSGDEEKVSLPLTEPRASPSPPEVAAAPAPPAAGSEPPAAAEEPAQLDVRSALASIDARDLGVPPSVLDSAVRQVLKEHRDLLAPASRPHIASDDDSDGDCPNFSIYSATSVHIANNTSVLGPETMSDLPQDNLEDLVQEDDTPTPEPDQPESEPEPEPEPEPADSEPPTPPHKHIAPDTKVKKKSEEEYNEKVSKRCPITTKTRNPIKIKLNTPSLIKRHVSLYEAEEEESGDAPPADRDQPPDADALITARRGSPTDKDDTEEPTKANKNDISIGTPEITKESEELPSAEAKLDKKEQSGDMTPEPRDTPPSPREKCADETQEHQQENLDTDGLKEMLKETLGEQDENEPNSDNEFHSDDESESGALERPASKSPKETPVEPNDDALEKMTESISETEDERSYTPCLDENKSKDTSLETDKDKGIEGLDTEMISEDEGNEMFSEEERARSEPSRVSPPPRTSPAPAPVDRSDDKKEAKSEVEVKKKKKKESKKEVKDRGKGKRKTDVTFRKLSKNGKERNYRERDKDGVGDRERRDSTDSVEREKRKRKRKEKRKDLERYDVRTVVSEKRRKRKDPFGRDVSPRARSRSPLASPRPKSTKRKKRARSERPASRRRSPRRKSPRRRRARRRSASRVAEASPVRALAPAVVPPEPAGGWSPGSVDSRLASPRTPPPVPSADDAPARRRRDPERTRHRRLRDAGGASKEVFTSGDNILVSVSFKEQERDGDDDRRERRRERRRRRKRAPAPEPETGAARPVAIIDLERSPFRELTPSPRNVIVLSDSEPGEREGGPAPEPAPSEPVGPKTPPEPAAPEVAPAPETEESRGPNTPPEPPDSPDAYDPYEPTRSASASPSPSPLPTSPPRTTITLETAQKTNMSADEVLDRRPLSPIEKGPPVRIVLPEPTRAAPPKLFLAKPSPIKSDPIKPMQVAKLPRPAPADSPYSPGSSDFGELFEPPSGGGGGGARRDPFDALAPRTRRKRNAAAKVPVKLDRNKGKMQVGVKIDEDNLKILDDLPSSAVEMQVKSKFLKKLNRQERVVEEVKLVLKPHYNKKHVTKEEYKDILRRAVPKICHNKSGEINPTKIQALIEAYVKKIRKKHKLGLV